MQNSTFIEQTGYGVLVSVPIRLRARVIGHARVAYFSVQSDLFDYRQGCVAFPGSGEPTLREERAVRARADRAMKKAGYRTS